MRNLWWICWYLWEGLPSLFAFPIESTESLGTGESRFTYWEHRWHRYAIGALGLIVVALTLAGCLCCRRQRRPKGFQDDAGNGKEFKDGSTAGTETTVERVPSASLELEVSRIASSHSANSKVQFEALPVERLVVESRISAKPKPPSPSLFFENRKTETKNFLREQPCSEWFDPENRHVPRERLKYLREIGRGWFGKVVEGTTEITDDDEKKNRGAVVRILTEEATTREKAWFLGEATPYLKLDHPNILKLLGCCLETDPYLLLFESCPAGDLKGFLRGNRDRGTCDVLRKENVPERMAIDIANALEHMHDNGFAHTDLSARNCLVASDLSIKLGDYGTGVEKYPDDYYVVGDRALPIRWSAPESLDCTETTIETRAITPRANLWSYAVVLWEMSTWGERPYDDYGDENVMEMIFSRKNELFARETSDLLTKRMPDDNDLTKKFREAIAASWKFLPDDRASLKESRDIIAGRTIENFEKRWENFKPNDKNSTIDRDNRSSSLHDLRTNVNLEIRQTCSNDKKNFLQPEFRLGPDEPVKNQSTTTNFCFQESGSETEEESWRGRVERGAYTEKVKQKSKSVADLMVLVHIDSDSDPEISIGNQTNEKISKKRMPSSGSDGDLRSHVIADEFDQAIRKLREPTVCNGAIAKTTINDNREKSRIVVDDFAKPKLLTLVHQGQTSILRLSFENSDNTKDTIENIDNFEINNSPTIINEKTIFSSTIEDESREDANEVCKKIKLPSEETNENNLCRDEKTSMERNRIDGPVLRLVSQGNEEFPLLRYVPERNSSSHEISTTVATTLDDDSRLFDVSASGFTDFSNNFVVGPTITDDSTNVESWNNALARELEKKNPRFDVESTIFDVTTNPSLSNNEESFGRSTSAKSVDFLETTTIAKKYYSSSAPESPAIIDNHSRTRATTLTNVDRRDDASVGSSSAPVTPVKRRDEPERLLTKRSKLSTCQGDSTGSFNASVQPDDDSSTCEDAFERINRLSSAETPPSPGNYSVVHGDEDSSTGEELEAVERKRSSGEVVVDDDDDDDDDVKRLSTPDDERSSDSGFRDKESCEDEESPIPRAAVTSTILSSPITSTGIPIDSSPLSASAEEEQMRILFELDTILDAEYYGSFRDNETTEETEISSPASLRRNRDNDGDVFIVKNRSISESIESTESTDVVETVRANSCEPDFLEGRNSDEIARSASLDDDDDEKIGSENFEKTNDLATREKDDENNLGVETSDDTEADFFIDSTSESLKTDKNVSDRSSEILEFLRKNSDDLTTKNDSKSNDSSTDLRRSNAEGSSSGKFDVSNDFSLELRSSDFSELNRSKTTTDSTSDSPMKTDRSIGNDLSTDLRRNVGSNVADVDGESIDRSLQKIDDSKSLDVSLELDDFSNNSATTIGERHVDSEYSVAAADIENSADDSSLNHRGKHDGTTKILGNDSPSKIERFNENSDDAKEKSIESTSFSPRIIVTTFENSQPDETPIQLENSSGNSSTESQNLIEISPIHEITTEIENFAGDSSSSGKKNIRENSETREATTQLENSVGNSSTESQNLIEISPIHEITSDIENFAGDSSSSGKKNIRENSETREAATQLENSVGNSSPMSQNLIEISPTPEITTEIENSTSDSSLSIDKNIRENSETREAPTQLENSVENPSPKSQNFIEISLTPEIKTEIDDSTSDSSSSINKNIREYSETREAPTQLENSVGNSSPKIQNLIEISATPEITTEIENSTSDSSLSIEKNIRENSETREAPTQLENSVGNSSPKIQNLIEIPPTLEITTEIESSTSESSSSIDKNIRENSETRETPTQLENSVGNSSSNSQNLLEISPTLEITTEIENSTSDASSSIDKNIRGNSETRETPTQLENSVGNSSPKSQNLIEISPTLEITTEIESSTSDSSSSIDKNIRENSEIREALTQLENSVGNSSPKSQNLIEISPTLEITTLIENPGSDSSSSDRRKFHHENSETYEATTELENSTIDSPLKSERPNIYSDIFCEASETELENSTSESPVKTDRNQTSDVSMETRGPESVHSDVENWSSRENINENDNEDEDSSTMSLRSDNSYVSFGLDEEFVTAIRNELREKLPRAQMPVIESLDPRDDKEPSINKDADGKRWDDEETEDAGERGTGNVDISIRYNIYGTPLSPILEERESAGTSESLVSKEDSRDDASIASRVSALSEDVLVVDTRTNRAMMLEGNATVIGEASNSQHDDDRDTSHGDFSDDENLDYPQNNLTRNMETKRLCMGSGGAPLPSPEEESKWQQQFPLPLQMQDDLMSTSFGTDRDWDSQDEDEGDDDGEEGDEDEEENSSSSGEFVWKRYDESHGDLENVATRSPPNKPRSHEPEADLEEEDEGDDDDDEEEEEEFTPSAWDATLAPHRSALRSPEKNLKSGDQKKSVWFKKQRYHCVYEYPKENPIAESHGQTATTWEPTSYADWEEMMDEPRLDVYPMDYDEINRPGDEEFYVSSSNRPFQFQSGEGKYVSQFFPGASSTLLQHQQQQQQQQPVTMTSEDNQEPRDEVDGVEAPTSPHSTHTNGHSRIPDVLETQRQQQQQRQLQQQLGELRHTRDRLKLNLLSTSGATKTDEDVVDHQITETVTENSTNKNLKIPEITKESSETVKNASEDAKKMETRAKIFEKDKPIVSEASEMSRSASSSSRINLSVSEESGVKMNDEQDDESSTDATKPIVVKNKNALAEKASPGDDTTVIKSDNEDSFAKEKLRTMGDQKNPSDTNVTFARETIVDEIVDIPNLEKEESPENAKTYGDGRESIAKATKNEDSNVRHSVADSSTSLSSIEATIVNEKSSNIVQTSET